MYLQNDLRKFCAQDNKNEDTEKEFVWKKMSITSQITSSRILPRNTTHYDGGYLTVQNDMHDISVIKITPRNLRTLSPLHTPRTPPICCNIRKYECVGVCVCMLY